jgi:MFS transporter, AAHS family, 4-hydroxybenzoate transporter
MGEPKNVVEIIDGQKVSGFQIRIAVLCAIALMLDGFDNQAIAYVAPALKAAWRFREGALGPVFTASVVGVAIGSALIGPFADRFGRSKVLTFTVLFFGVLSALVAQATTISQLFVLRFFIGLGLGAVIPLVVVLCSEYAPARHRAKMVTFMTCGYAVGAATGGFLASHLVPRFGWTSVFYVGAVAPIILVAALLVWMPESIRFLTLREDHAAVAKILRKINPSLQFEADTRFFLAARDRGLSASYVKQFGDLFREGRSVITVLLWACLFMNLIDLNFLNNWLPTLIIHMGLPQAQALRTAPALQLGGIVGIAVMGVLVDRFGYYKVLATAFAFGGLAMAGAGGVGVNRWAMWAVFSISGFAVIGSQMTIAALSATLYPTRIRATGSSWAFAVARLLSIVGPLLGGVLIDAGVPISQIFFVAAIPLFFASVIVLVMQRAKNPEAQIGEPAAAAMT